MPCPAERSWGLVWEFHRHYPGVARERRFASQVNGAGPEGAVALPGRGFKILTWILPEQGWEGKRDSTGLLAPPGFHKRKQAASRAWVPYPWALACSSRSILLRNSFRVAGSRRGPISVRTKALERSATEGSSHCQKPKVWLSLDSDPPLCSPLEWLLIQSPSAQLRYSHPSQTSCFSCPLMLVP